MISAPDLFVAFGKVRDPERVLAREGRELAASGRDLGIQCALIGPGTCAFRLNSPGWFRATPALIAALPDRKGLRLLCRDRIEKAVPAFSAHARRWITLYLDHVEAVAGRAIDPSDHLTHPSDRFFAALLPLPAPSVGKLRGGAGNLQVETALDIVRFDLVFWDGSTLVAILFGAENTTTPGKRAAIAALERALAPRLRVRRIENNEDSVSLAAQLAADVRQAPAPHYGPYRVASLFGAHVPTPSFEFPSWVGGYP